MLPNDFFNFLSVVPAGPAQTGSYSKEQSLHLFADVEPGAAWIALTISNTFRDSGKKLNKIQYNWIKLDRVQKEEQRKYFGSQVNHFSVWFNSWKSITKLVCIRVWHENETKTDCVCAGLAMTLRKIINQIIEQFESQPVAHIQYAGNCLNHIQSRHWLVPYQMRWTNFLLFESFEYFFY